MANANANSPVKNGVNVEALIAARAGPGLIDRPVKQTLRKLGSATTPDPDTPPT